MKLLFLPVVLLPLSITAQPTSAQTPPKKDECRIAGTVVKLAGREPLKNARIRLLSQDDRTLSRAVVSDAAGRFDLKGVSPGRYRLVVHRDGFVSQTYGQKKSDDPGAILTLRANQELRDVLFRLIPSAVIAGRVINDDGDPMRWVQVNALREVYFGGKRTLFPETTVTTSDFGEYRLVGLSPGRYFIRAEYKPNERPSGRGEFDGVDDEPRGYVPMYYPSSTEPARANTVAVRAGEEIPGIQVLLRRVDVFTVRGQVYNMTAKRSNASYNLSLSPRGEDAWLRLPQRDAVVDDKNGTFTIRDVLPGPYLLGAFWMDEGRRYQAFQSIDVGNADVDGIALTVLSGMSVSGRLTWDGQPTSDRNRLVVYLRAAEGSYGYGSRATVALPWTFVLNDVYDLTYRVGVAGLCDDCYLKTLRYAGATSPEDTFTPARGSNATLEVTISSKG